MHKKCTSEPAILVGATGFEPATSWSQTTRSSQTEPYPELSYKITLILIFSSKIHQKYCFLINQYLLTDTEIYGIVRFLIQSKWYAKNKKKRQAWAKAYKAKRKSKAENQKNA